MSANRIAEDEDDSRRDDDENPNEVADDPPWQIFPGQPTAAISEPDNPVGMEEEGKG